MGRVKIKFPDENPLFIAFIPVRIGDINYGGHLGNDAVLTIIHEARMQLLRQWNYSELDAGGNSLIMADAMIGYLSEAFYGDILKVSIYVEEITNLSFDLLYHITVTRNGVETDVARAKTGMVCYDYELKKVSALKEPLKNRLQRIEPL